MGLHADLASLSSTLDQMIERVEGAAASLEGAGRDDLLADLYEIERHLLAANRRLHRTLAAMPELS